MGLFSTARWPATLREDAWNEPPFGTLVLRPLRRRDGAAWRQVRRDNHDWLTPWDATVPLVEGEPYPLATTYLDYIAGLNRAARTGEGYMWGMFLDGEFCGQISLGSIAMGSLRSAVIGYWVAQGVAGRGVTPSAVAMVLDHAFSTLALHRVEINIRPENAPSLRVVEKLGLRYEGLRKNYLHINGQWTDHRSYAITQEEVGAGILNRWRGRDA